MVELHEDTRGKSALIAGAEDRSWRQLSNDKGLVDSYLCAVETTGGSYTRQAFCGRRFDRARLDRCYISEGAEWMHVINQGRNHEMASGARLNLNKTTIIPLTHDILPDWLLQTGCQIAKEGDRHRYLGILEGVDILDEEITADIQTRYEKHLKHWANMLLTWPEKLLLCKSILNSLPHYTLMTVRLSPQGMKKVKKVTRDFLWGENERGNKKKPLIAWEIFERRKQDGGLCWVSLTDMAAAFLMKNVTKLIVGEGEEWIEMAQQIIMQKVRTLARPQEVKTWNATEILLGIGKITTPSSPTLDRMLKTWFRTRKMLKWKPRAGKYPNTRPISFYIMLLQKNREIELAETRLLRKAARKAKISNFSQLQRQDGNRISFTMKLQEKGVPIDSHLLNALQKVDTAFPTLQATDINWTQADGWEWENLPHRGEQAWRLTTAAWRKLMYLTPKQDTKFNQRWGIQDTKLQWNTRWKRLWAGKATQRTKIRLWRYIRRGYFTNHKAKEWGIGDGICARCKLEVETFEHAVWNCPRIQKRTACMAFNTREQKDNPNGRTGTPHQSNRSGVGNPPQASGGNAAAPHNPANELEREESGTVQRKR
ncbi:hypothetical protein R1sor_018183 [Riccia sorocarpa]|uniref:Reverse transcriptase zinc-binding domain-containing protein n=1 Tax=Riccia sorocarpa TaxID=122646 RepID=A0ABD3I9E0_9MARC